MTVARTVARRLYSDFLMPSRLGEFRKLLVLALEQGYRIHSLGGFWALSCQGRRRPEGRHLVMRHDVDTDTGTAREMWKICHELGTGGSYFFRLSTMDDRLIQEIASSGDEASYHFEELSTVCKRRLLKTRDAALKALPEIRELFLANLEAFRRRTGLQAHIVAAHGDWVNRRLGCSNVEVLADEALRKRAAIDLEAYDQALVGLYDKRFADLGYPLWSPDDPAQAIRSGIPVLQLLVHSRQWRVNVIENVSENVRRAVEGVRFGLGGAR